MSAVWWLLAGSVVVMPAEPYPVLSQLMKLPVYEEDRTNPLKEPQLIILANAIDAAAGTPEDKAYLITIGFFETGFSLRVHAGQCRKWECDPLPKGGFSARGWGQVHRNGMNSERWEKMVGIDHSDEQALVIEERIQGSRHWCGVEPESVFADYLGLKCKARTKGTHDRAEFYRHVLAKLKAGAP